ncbi:MAG TPA: trehalose-6-phosphate synthase [Casimicrobiaceae bacterium]|jgi:trehalose 6-phosphate synthase|nr:trehalose-6-phosphate synthase [Casimicrobiaceae bacterium]
MRLSLRFIIPLLIALALAAYATVPLIDRQMLSWFSRDLDARATLLAHSAEDPVLALVNSGDNAGIETYFGRLTNDERLFAIGLCPPGAVMPLATSDMPPQVDCALARRRVDLPGQLVHSGHGLLHVAVRAIPAPAGASMPLILVHDMTFAERRSEDTKRYMLVFFVALGAVIALITVAIAQMSWRGWVTGLRALLRGEGLFRPSGGIVVPELAPIARDVRRLVRDLESHYRPRDEDQLTWTSTTLRSILRGDMQGNNVIVVSNREPYMHIHRDDRIEVLRPASGLVTALEPVMRACSGTWIAHGSGDADRETVDAQDHVPVPPEDPAYRIRRIWLSADEEAGYYSGFANEGLWPLCHIAHVRPIFRARDFDYYRAVNQRFADAVVDEAQRDDPIVLVQDYHFALLPRMVREKLPRATIITFWHIPWPNPEAFAICPWRDELLDGMLGSSILGFHTQIHCNNFLDTVDRTLEARVDRESFAVTRNGQRTEVHRYPISIEWPPEALAGQPDIPTTRATVRRRLNLPADHKIGIGIDRLDYTKGILERFSAVERLLQLEPQWVGRFTFVQIAAPTRGMIDDYRDYAARVKTLADRINASFSNARHPPIALLSEHHDTRAVYEYFRASDLCFVSSLHDGMNLVAKEFIAARDDEQGVLILSQFAGASRELPEALVVNPYDADQCAAALHLALTMPLDEQRARMRLMRALVRDFNVYRWAGRMLMDAAMMRQRNRLFRFRVPEEAA